MVGYNYSRGGGVGWVGKIDRSGQPLWLDKAIKGKMGEDAAEMKGMVMRAYETGLRGIVMASLYGWTKLSTLNGVRWVTWRWWVSCGQLT